MAVAPGGAAATAGVVAGHRSRAEESVATLRLRRIRSFQDLGVLRDNFNLWLL